MLKCLQHHRLRLDFIVKMSIIDYYRDELLSQVEKFKYPEVLLRLIDAVSASSVHCGKVRVEHKKKLSIYQSVYIPTLTYGHELWIVTKRSGGTQNRASFHIEMRQLRWFRMPPGRGFPGMSYWKLKGCPGVSPGHAREITSLSCLGNVSVLSGPDELEGVAGETEIWAHLLRLLRPRPRSSFTMNRLCGFSPFLIHIFV